MKQKFKLLLLLFALGFAISQVQAQNAVTVKGILKDPGGAPLQGVSVRESAKNGTITNEKGEFTIVVQSSKASLEFAFVGYLTQKLPLNGQTQLTVILKTDDDKAKLGDVVVVAYGSQKKTTVTGSVAQVKGADLAKAPVSNVSNSLQGRLPGLTALQSGGQPGSDATAFNIRGFGNALLIVDGVPADFTQLDPNEIESISILKDGSAAVYGFRAANGVILVTTKKGASSKPKISYTGYYGWQSPTRYPKFMSAGQFAQLTDESAVNQGNPVVYGVAEVEKWMTGTDSTHQATDWYNSAIRQNAPQTYSNVNVSGGNDVTKYFFSGGIVNQDGMWRSGDTYFKRYNFRSNISTKISKRITTELNIGGRVENRYNPSTGVSALMGMIQRSYPTEAAYANNNPDYYALPNIGGNILANSNAGYSGYDKSQWRVFTGTGSINYEIPFIKGLNAKILYSYSSTSQNEQTWSKQFNLYTYSPTSQTYNVGYTGNPTTTLNLFTSQANQNVFQFSMNYNSSFGNGHNIKGLFVFEKTKADYTNFGASRGFTVDGLDQLFAGTSNINNYENMVTADNIRNNVNVPQTANMGYVGRVNYDYKGRYLLEAGFRYDGSYKYAPNKRFGFFPTISAGWRINSEPFFKFDVISNLKLRASWGKMGDDSYASGFQYLTGYSYPSGSYIFSNGVLTSGLTPSVLPDQTLTWTNVYTSNLGFELGILKNMFTVDFDVFYRKRTGIPATSAQTIPGTVGANLPQQNLNSDNTRGFELVLGFNKKIGNVMVNVSPNLAWNRSRNGFIEQSAYTNAVENYLNNSTNRWSDLTWGYKALGQFKNQNEIATSPVQDNQANNTLKPGDIKYADVNHDGVIDSRDQTIIGRGPYPELQYGLNLSAAYKGFDISALFAGAANFNITYSGEMQQPFFNNSNSYAFFTDRWHHADIYDPTSAWIPGKLPSTVANGNPNNNVFSSFWLQNAAYVRLKTIQIGYTIPANLTSKAGISQVRFYVSGQNLFTITGVNSLDPEAPPSTVSGGNGAYYPQQRVITVGLNAQF